MTASRTGREHRLKAFKLSEVPEGVRLRALDKLLTTAGTNDGMLVPTFSFADRVALGVAASRPSERVYWVSRAAWERVMSR